MLQPEAEPLILAGRPPRYVLAGPSGISISMGNGGLFDFGPRNFFGLFKLNRWMWRSLEKRPAIPWTESKVYVVESEGFSDHLKRSGDASRNR